MSANFTFSSPVTGAAQTGFTSPTYTLTEDNRPSMNATQYAVTALGGTQDGVDSHSSSLPFTATLWTPKQAVSLPLPDSNGNYRNIPRAKFKLITRKGVTLSNGQRDKIIVRTEVEMPAGADVDDPEAVRAAQSLHIGLLSGESAGWGDMLVTGI